LLSLHDINLGTDPAARRVQKNERVMVEFAAGEGVLESAVGLNRFAPGDALLTGSTGDRWCVSRDRFDEKYRPEPAVRHGQPGAYRNLPVALLAKQMSEAFSVPRSHGGDVLRGHAGDWLIEYARGDYGIIARARFDRVYTMVDPQFR
jgi:PGDYG protein